MSKTSLGPCVTFFPQPTTILTTVNSAGEVNLMTASWAGIISKTPPTIGVSLNRDRLTYANIRETGSFVVNMVPSSLALEADFCGIRSGRSADKLATTRLQLERARHVEAPLLQASPLSVECRLTTELPLDEYILVVGEILDIHVSAEALNADGSFNVAHFDPLVYLGGVREYWNLGEKQATAYRDGLALEKEE